MYRDASGQWEDNRFQPLVSAAFNLILNISLVRIIGINGIIISTIISMLVIDIPWESFVFFRKQFDTTVFDYITKLLGYFTVTAISCSIVFFFKMIIVIHNIYFRLAFDVIIAAIVSGILFLFVYRKKAEMVFMSEKAKAITNLLLSAVKRNS